MQNMYKRLVPFFAVVHGCRVNMRCTNTQTLISKAWKVMSTHKKMAENLNLPCHCPKGYQHGRCEGGQAGRTAYYTQEFANRVSQALLIEHTHETLQDELQGQTTCPPGFNEGHHCVCEQIKKHDARIPCGTCQMGAQTNSTRITSEGCQGKLSEAFVSRHLEHEQQTEQIKKKLYLLHASTGHGSTRHMIRALEHRGAPEHVLELARNFQCPIRKESQKVNHRHLSSLEPLPPKLATVSADGGKWTNPHTNEESEFVVAIDEGSRFRISQITKHGKHQTMSAAIFLNFLRERWIQYFGAPQTLRVDPAGAFRSHELERFCDENSIFLDVIAGEAHWQLGTCEQAVRGLKEVMTKLSQSNPDLSAEACLSEATRVFNHREMIRGFAPVQHLLGKALDETGRFVGSLTGDSPPELLNNPSEEMEQSIQLMKQAEQALSEWQANQRIGRAMNSRSQPRYDYRPGDLVYFWRKQVKNKGVGKNGMFLGPAWILCTETKRDDHGNLHRGASIWCVRGRRLVFLLP